jgi:hypothetical protein
VAMISCVPRLCVIVESLSPSRDKPRHVARLID